MSAALAADCTADMASAAEAEGKSCPEGLTPAVELDADWFSDVLPTLGGVVGSFPYSGGTCDGGSASSVAPGIPALEIGVRKRVGIG